MHSSAVHAKGERALAKSIIGSKTREKNVEQQNAKPLRVVGVVPGCSSPLKRKHALGLMREVNMHSSAEHAKSKRALAQSILVFKTREKNGPKKNAKPLRVVGVVPGCSSPLKRKKRIRFDTGMMGELWTASLQPVTEASCTRFAARDVHQRHLEAVVELELHEVLDRRRRHLVHGHRVHRANRPRVEHVLRGDLAVLLDVALDPGDARPNWTRRDNLRWRSCVSVHVCVGGEVVVVQVGVMVGGWEGVMCVCVCV